MNQVQQTSADGGLREFVADLGDSTAKAAALTKWDVIDRDSGERFGRELSHTEATALARQLGQWARVVFHSPQSSSDGSAIK